MMIIKHRRVWYAVGGLLIAACVALIAIYGLRFGIDFTGGSLLEVNYTDTRPDVEAVRQALGQGFEYGVVSPTGSGD